MRGKQWQTDFSLEPSPHDIYVFRLETVAFLWQEIGTNSLNRPQTREIIKLLRTLIEYRSPHALVITESKIPNRENLAYFGNANEAHIIYNVSLTPLLLHGLLSDNNHCLNNGLMCMTLARDGTTYLNFIASHDGIELRPVGDMLDEAELSQIVEAMQSFGGQIFWRNLNQHKVRAYEVNISLIDALKSLLRRRKRFTSTEIYGFTHYCHGLRWNPYLLYTKPLDSKPQPTCY